MNLLVLHRFERGRHGLCDPLEADRIAGLELPELPEVGLDDRCRANKPAEAGTVGAQDDRQIPGEVDGTDGVGVVVDV